MKIFNLLLVTAVVALSTACQEDEKPVPMQAKVNSQVEIVGNKANIVRSDTISIVIVRDSIADEKTDTIYNLKTSLTLVLDSTFMADKMEAPMKLQINDITFIPMDSAYADSLINFLKSDVGTKTTIEFTGKTERSKFLQLSNVVKVSLVGFSFHELDPEAMADPKITKLLNEYEKRGVAFEKLEEEEVMAAVFYVGDLKERAKLAHRLGGMRSKMTPKQLERFEKLQKRFGDNY